MRGVNAMKYILGAAIAAWVAVANPVAAADVGVSVSIGQPGFYGQIDIGNYPRPEVIYAEPVIIHRPVGVVYDPIYLRVPPGQAKKWGSYCGRYNACGRPVYFVQDRWYHDVYVPEYHNRHHDRDDDHGHGPDRDHDHDRGHGNHGKGHGRD